MRMDAAVSALSDPTRRQILLMLRDGARGAGAIAGAFSVTRPAISRHLRVLREAGLVVDEARGRERVYRLELAPLAAIEDFIGRLRVTTASEWERRFLALDTEVHRVKRDSKKRAAAARAADQPRHKPEEKTG
jgi:DNA-binding transcriptional ArsR family regulator